MLKRIIKEIQNKLELKIDVKENNFFLYENLNNNKKIKYFGLVEENKIEHTTSISLTSIDTNSKIFVFDEIIALNTILKKIKEINDFLNIDIKINNILETNIPININSLFKYRFNLNYNELFITNDIFSFTKEELEDINEDDLEDLYSFISKLDNPYKILINTLSIPKYEEFNNKMLEDFKEKIKNDYNIINELYETNNKNLKDFLNPKNNSHLKFIINNLDTLSFIIDKYKNNDDIVSLLQDFSIQTLSENNKKILDFLLNKIETPIPFKETINFSYFLNNKTSKEILELFYNKDKEILSEFSMQLASTLGEINDFEFTKKILENSKKDFYHSTELLLLSAKNNNEYLFNYLLEKYNVEGLTFITKQKYLYPNIENKYLVKIAELKDNPFNLKKETIKKIKNIKKPTDFILNNINEIKDNNLNRIQNHVKKYINLNYKDKEESIKEIENIPKTKIITGFHLYKAFEAEVDGNQSFGNLNDYFLNNPERFNSSLIEKILEKKDLDFEGREVSILSLAFISHNLYIIKKIVEHPKFNKENLLKDRSSLHIALLSKKDEKILDYLIENNLFLPDKKTINYLLEYFPLSFLEKFETFKEYNPFSFEKEDILLKRNPDYENIKEILEKKENDNLINIKENINLFSKNENNFKMEM